GTCGGAMRQASSTSLMTSACARASSGVRGFHPGEATIRSGSVASARSASRSASASAMTSTPAGRSRSWALGTQSAPVTRAPSSVATWAADRPEIPRPATSTRRPEKSSALARRAGSYHDPLGVEQSHSEADEQGSDDPEPDHDGHLTPTHEFEVVMQGSHLEHTPSGG